MVKRMLKDIEWKSSDGKIKVIEMKKSHIQNCINLLNRNMNTYDDRTKKFAQNWIKIFDFELKRREKVEERIEDYLQNLFYDLCEEDFQPFLF